MECIEQRNVQCGLVSDCGTDWCVVKISCDIDCVVGGLEMPCFSENGFLTAAEELPDPICVS